MKLIYAENKTTQKDQQRRQNEEKKERERTATEKHQQKVALKTSVINRLVYRLLGLSLKKKPHLVTTGQRK
jgi:hypothetical protein